MLLRFALLQRVMWLKIDICTDVVNLGFRYVIKAYGDMSMVLGMSSLLLMFTSSINSG